MKQRQTNIQTTRQTSEIHAGEPNIDIFEIASRLRLVVTRTARKMRQEAGGDLTPTALAVLASIDRNAPLTPSELATIEDVTRPTITRVVGNLADAGLIERSDDPEDGRSCLLSVTEAGSTYLAERRKLKSAYMAEMLDTLEADDIETLSRAADILDAALLNRARKSPVQESENFEAPR